GAGYPLAEARAKQSEVTEKGIDRVHRGASCLLSGGLVHRRGPVGPLLQGSAEDVGLVAQAGDGVTHGASLERLASVSRGLPTVVTGHAGEYKSFGRVADVWERLAERAMTRQTCDSGG